MMGRLLHGILVFLVPLIVLVSSTVVTLSEHPRLEFEISSELGISSTGATVAGPSTPRLIATCLPGYGPFSVAFDPADGYIYATLSISPPQISILKSPCNLVKVITIPSGGILFGIAYDPVTKEMVAIDQGAHAAYVLQGTALAKAVRLGSPASGGCPEFDVWDSALGAMLITDQCRGGVDVLKLTETDGVTHASTKLDAFDAGNLPTGILVADGYIFSAGLLTDVFNDRTLAYLGSFGVTASAYYSPLAWDPLNQTVVLGTQNGYASEDAYFLDANSIANHIFSFHNLRAHNILEGGVGGITYSPANRNLYITSMGGDDVWILNPTGGISHVYLQPPIGMWNTAYNPANQDVYICGFDMYVVS